MKKIFGENSFSLFPLPNGFIVAEKKPLESGEIAAVFRLISIDKQKVSVVSKDIYDLAKFGQAHSSFDMQFTNTVEPKAVHLPDGRVFVASPDGDARIFDSEAHTKWQGTMEYNGFGPFDIVGVENKIWASYPASNALIRFNMQTMREELRIGGGDNSAFSTPEGLWMGDEPDTMLVCNAGSKKICALNLGSYTIIDYAKFDEPVHQYIKVGPHELVLLDSGVYIL